MVVQLCWLSLKLPERSECHVVRHIPGSFFSRQSLNFRRQRRAIVELHLPMPPRDGYNQTNAVLRSSRWSLHSIKGPTTNRGVQSGKRFRYIRATRHRETNWCLLRFDRQRSTCTIDITTFDRRACPKRRTSTPYFRMPLSKSASIPFLKAVVRHKRQSSYRGCYGLTGRPFSSTSQWQLFPAVPTSWRAQSNRCSHQKLQGKVHGHTLTRNGESLTNCGLIRTAPNHLSVVPVKVRLSDVELCRAFY